MKRRPQTEPAEFIGNSRISKRKKAKRIYKIKRIKMTDRYALAGFLAMILANFKLQKC
ncbi:MAG: hypothetical protein SPE49_06910 [Campylobacter sp.]|uniref:hypothetical protein n=1 Tax=Campylobacter sp. TaxID=205 RepID=UPI002A810857|nr:hypothetical protein [Campylobacter sp.]MDY5115678.1 hypothetical protein [Campylobacter sp.]MDY5385068.1 hypothetical protein [Campylobacter sp.]